MTTTKVALSISSEAIARAKREVQSGRAKSLSAFVTEALEEKLERDDLAEILDAMDAEQGPPGKKARQWARRVLSPSS
jgi:Arc/MetJ-type ribon-helix-helix transcriptional regulator